MNMQRSNDTKLASAAKCLPRVEFREPLSDPLPSNAQSFHGVYFHIITLSWIVRMSISGKQYTLGVIRRNLPDAREKAVRFADMAMLFFWKYRRIGEPTNADFNISLEQAQRDLNSCEEGREILQSIEKRLEFRGALFVKQRAEAALDPIQVGRTFARDWRRAFREFEKTRKAFSGDAAAAIQIGMLSESIANLDKQIGAFENSFLVGLDKSCISCTN